MGQWLLLWGAICVLDIMYDWSNSPDTSGKEIFELWIIISYVFMPVCLLSICLWCDIALWCYACGKCVHAFIIFPYFNWVSLYIDAAEYMIIVQYQFEKFIVYSSFVCLSMIINEILETIAINQPFMYKPFNANKKLKGYPGVR